MRPYDEESSLFYVAARVTSNIANRGKFPSQARSIFLSRNKFQTLTAVGTIFLPRTNTERNSFANFAIDRTNNMPVGAKFS